MSLARPPKGVTRGGDLGEVRTLIHFGMKVMELVRTFQGNARVLE